MTIKYKFNKSSEARDCVVESVELEVMKENKTIIDLNTVCDILDKYESDKPTDEVKTVEDILCFFDDIRFDNVEDEIIDEESYGNRHRISGDYEFENKILFVTLEYLHQSGHGDFNCKLIESYVIDTSLETKTFTSPQQLKDYINTTQEPIEFIAKSSIDDVLMKEWIGEWEYQNGCANKYCTYKEDSNCWDFNCCKHFIKSVGSPKLNSNWTFKIQ